MSAALPRDPVPDRPGCLPPLLIRSVSITPCVQPQEDPTWRMARGGIPRLDGWVVSVIAEHGEIGYGHVEAMGFYADNLAGTRAALDEMAALLIGRDALRIEPILLELDHAFHQHVTAKAGIDCALHELAARYLRVPLHVLLGGAVRSRVPVQRILSMKDPEAMAVDAARLAGQGYRSLKIKVDGDMEAGVRRVAAIRERVGPAIQLSVDANQAFKPKQAIQFVRAIEADGVDLIEQPVAWDDRAGLKLVRDTVGIMVEADESVRSVRDVMELAAMGACDSFNLKINGLGGLRNTLTAARVCEAAGVCYRVGTAYGPRLVAAQSFHLAAALPRAQYPVELAEFEHLLDDPFTGFEIVDGEASMPDGIGCGVSAR